MAEPTFKQAVTLALACALQNPAVVSTPLRRTFGYTQRGLLHGQRYDIALKHYAWLVLGQTDEKGGLLVPGLPRTPWRALLYARRRWKAHQCYIRTLGAGA